MPNLYFKSLDYLWIYMDTHKNENESLKIFFDQSRDFCKISLIFSDFLDILTFQKRKRSYWSQMDSFPTTLNSL